MKNFIVILFVFTTSIIFAQPPLPPTNHGGFSGSLPNNRYVYNNSTGQFELYNEQSPIGTSTLALIILSSLYVLTKTKTED